MTHPFARDCQCGRDPDGAEFICSRCERIAEWKEGRAGDPSCPICNGHGWYADGDALAGVQWPETCECLR